MLEYIFLDNLTFSALSWAGSHFKRINEILIKKECLQGIKQKLDINNNNNNYSNDDNDNGTNDGNNNVAITIIIIWYYWRDRLLPF